MPIMWLRRLNGWTIIEVEGLPEWKYLYYSKREAIKLYRQRFDLVGKKLQLIEL